jgi:hypothetical protein
MILKATRLGEVINRPTKKRQPPFLNSITTKQHIFNPKWHLPNPQK